MVIWIVIFVLLLLTLLLRMFIKRMFPIVLILVFVSCSAYWMFDQSRSTTFSNSYSQLYLEENEIERVTIGVHDVQADVDGLEREVTIDNPGTIERIVEDLSDVTYKRVVGAEHRINRFSLTFVVEDRVKEGFTSIERQYVSIGEDHVSLYPILSDTDHLETIQALANNQDLDWRQVDDE
ncbi:hypothetical protein H0266_04770 [Halobacillus locisalis]|uniref:Uncharacterized protein n=1 Tax=Halobacillus locisalis TaxID=220753 RepID=A0A838CQS1_9BACI|nr:hypothetical protein [Halobacillus locisalis]MBA2174213.1 hypothetical protein [Halobacillus locisalis]